MITGQSNGGFDPDLVIFQDCFLVQGTWTSYGFLECTLLEQVVRIPKD